MPTLRRAVVVLLLPSIASAHSNHGANELLDSLAHPHLTPEGLAAIVVVGVLASSLVGGLFAPGIKALIAGWLHRSTPAALSNPLERE